MRQHGQRHRAAAKKHASDVCEPPLRDVNMQAVRVQHQRGLRIVITGRFSASFSGAC